MTDKEWAERIAEWQYIQEYQSKQQANILRSALFEVAAAVFGKKK